jgi:hypothetical protein
MNRQPDATSGLDGFFGKPPPDAAAAEDASKDVFFTKIAEIAEAMIASHGKDFAMGVLVLSARFIAEGKPLIKRETGA